MMVGQFWRWRENGTIIGSSRYRSQILRVTYLPYSSYRSDVRGCTEYFLPNPPPKMVVNAIDLPPANTLYILYEGSIKGVGWSCNAYDRPIHETLKIYLPNRNITAEERKGEGDEHSVPNSHGSVLRIRRLLLRKYSCFPSEEEGMHYWIFSVRKAQGL